MDIYVVKSGIKVDFVGWEWMNLRAFNDYSKACQFAKKVENQIKPEHLGELEDVSVESLTLEK